MSQDRTVSVKLKLEIDSGGQAVVKQLTDVTQKAAKAAGDLKANMTPGGGISGGGGHPTTPGAIQGPTPGHFGGMGGLQFGPSHGRGVAMDNLSIIRNLQLGGIAGTAGRIQGFGAAAMELGFGGAGALASRAAIPLAIARSGADAAERIALRAHDRYSTNEQDSRQLFRELAPGGEWLQNKADAFSGRAQRMEDVEIRAEHERNQMAARAQIQGVNMHLSPRVAGLQATSDFYGSHSAITPSTADRSTGAGERQYQIEMRTLPLRQASQKALMESEKATAERVKGEKESLNLQQEQVRVQREISKLEASLSDPNNQSGPERFGVLKGLEVRREELSGIIGRSKEQIGRVAGLRDTEAGASGEAQKTGLRDRLGAQSERLKFDAETGLSSASRLGGQSPIDREIGLAYSIAFKNKQIDILNAPESIKGHFRNFAPQEYEKLTQEALVGSSIYKRAQAAGISDFPAGDPLTQRQAAQNLDKQISEGEFKISGEASKAIKGAWDGVAAAVAKEINKEAANTDKKIEELRKQIRAGKG